MRDSSSSLRYRGRFSTINRLWRKGPRSQVPRPPHRLDLSTPISSGIKDTPELQGVRITRLKTLWPLVQHIKHTLNTDDPDLSDQYRLTRTKAVSSPLEIITPQPNKQVSGLVQLSPRLRNHAPQCTSSIVDSNSAIETRDVTGTRFANQRWKIS